MEKLLPITIKGARITRISIDYDEKLPKYNATVALLNAKDEIVTSVCVGNAGWDAEKKAHLSVDIIDIGNKLREAVKIEVVRHMNKHQNALEA